MLTIQKLKQLQKKVKIATLCDLATYNAISQKSSKGSELSIKQSQEMSKELLKLAKEISEACI